MRIITAALLLCALPLKAGATMEFVRGGTDERTYDADWIQAEGVITETTLEDFLAFLDEGPDWLPRRIRFNSPGGNLAEGIRLGEELRRRGFATEVGSHEPHPDFTDIPYWEFTRRTPGECASACAYAFMGGVERRIEEGSLIGVHQFYTIPSQSDAEGNASELVPQGAEQEILSLLLDYMLRMGIDARVLVAAGLSGPEEMHWIGGGEEAQETGLSHASRAWTPWEIDLLGRGLLAHSSRTDGLYRMEAYCTQSAGATFELVIGEVRNPTYRDWLVDQCLPAGSSSQGQGAHNIVGNRVLASNIRIVNRSEGFGIVFPLGRNPVVRGNPSFLYEDYPDMACRSENFIGNEVSMQAAMQMAFRNCID